MLTTTPANHKVLSGTSQLNTRSSTPEGKINAKSIKKTDKSVKELYQKRHREKKTNH